jgi:hypothetical protein
VAWLRQRTRLEPALLAGQGFEDTLANRLRELGLAGDADYAALLERDAAERTVVQTLVAVPETWLFRTRASVEWLRERLAARRRERPGEPLRMLSAACANGAEAYSMAATALRPRPCSESFASFSARTQASASGRVSAISDSSIRRVSTIGDQQTDQISCSRSRAASLRKSGPAVRCAKSLPISAIAWQNRLASRCRSLR